MSPIILNKQNNYINIEKNTNEQTKSAISVVNSVTEPLTNCNESQSLIKNEKKIIDNKKSEFIRIYSKTLPNLNVKQDYENLSLKLSNEGIEFNNNFYQIDTEIICDSEITHNYFSDDKMSLSLLDNEIFNLSLKFYENLANGEIVKDDMIKMVEREFSSKNLKNNKNINYLKENENLLLELSQKVMEIIPWENEIIAFEENIKPNMMDILKAGWIPSNEIRTWTSYITHEFQKNKQDHEVLLLLLNILASLKMSQEYLDGNYNIKDWYNLFITETGRNYETDIYNLPTYITRHLISLQNSPCFEQNSLKTHIKGFMDFSNDKFYLEGQKHIKEDVFDESLLNIKHAYPTELMQRTIMPIYFDCVAARQFHRPILLNLTYGPLSKSGYHIIRNLQSHIKKKSKIMLKKRRIHGYTDISFMQTLDDITSTDSLIILIEYSEEYPPLLCQNGMNSKLIQFCRINENEMNKKNTLNHYPNMEMLKSNIPIQKIANKTYMNMNNSQYNIKNQNYNYVKQNIVKQNIENKNEIGIKLNEYGKPVYITKTSPFLGNLKGGQIILAIENNMYRAPLYQHKILDTDFLIIRNSGGYFIREFQEIFLAGQEIPKKVIPVPGSKASTKYNRDLLQIYIYRHFHRSKEIPPRIKTDEIRRLFKHNSENAIRKRLKYCSDYKRNSSNSNNGEVGSWQLRSNFILPSMDDLSKICKPEDACVYYSMISSERRLKVI